MESNLLQPPKLPLNSRQLRNNPAAKQPASSSVGATVGKSQQTSTPYELDKKKQADLIILDYFQTSPPSTNASYITGDHHGKTENLISFNGSEILNYNSNTSKLIVNKSVLSTNININNVSSASNMMNNPNLSNINNNRTADGEVISSQRVKKIIIQNPNQANEVQLKEKEIILKHLQSIDLTKFSFPNENKPKTDYTYAKTSSYLKECKQLVNDNCEMPNLCRRARKSPQSSNSASGALGSKSLSFNDSRSYEHSHDVSKRTINLYKYLKSFLASPPNAHQVENDPDAPQSDLLTSSQPQPQSQQAPPMAANANLKKGPIITITRDPLARSLTTDFDDPRAGFTPIGDVRHNQPQDGQQTSKSSSSNAAVNLPAASTSTSSIRVTKTLSNASTMTSPIRNSNGGSDGYQIHVDVQQTRRTNEGSFCCCNKLFILLLLTLVPFAIYGLNKLDEREHIYARLNESPLFKTYFNLEFNDESVKLVRNTIHLWSERIKYVLFDYLPSLFAYENLQNQTNKLKEKLNEYKPFTSGGYDLTKDIILNSGDDQQGDNLLKNFDSIKEKIIAETLSSFNDAKLADIDLIRRELDQKFNYTLTMMSNKLADQTLLFEQSKSTYENELKQMKSVLGELESRYSTLLNNLQEKQQHVPSDREVKSQLKETFSDEHVSFQKIEEYINRSFYLYNADKTGMTDFASESIGGSVLFYRCTEPYTENSRWFTVFDLPITRITVSPRVVIQNSIQPGNCWSFKGSKADLFIKLAAKITPTSFSLEHIPKELSLTGTIDSAPQNFTVYGYENKEQISDDLRLILGNFRYDNESKNTLQFFSAQHEYPDKAISVIELKIESNAGNRDYTCLYKFRVHGKLFSPNADKINNENTAQLTSNEQLHRQNPTEQPAEPRENS